MTPQELLQQQRRQQVEFNLAPPGITSRDIQAGQYSVAVQRTQPAEQTVAGRLADALGKINPIIAKYGEAQMAENELQILDIQKNLARMTPAEKNALMQSTDAEASLSKAFRADYEYNPVATFRGKMLLGAEKIPEFKSMLTERLEEFKFERVRGEGDKPSYSDVSAEIDRFTQNYLDQAGLNNEGRASMRLGFLQEASPYINKLKELMPAEFAQVHKEDLTMPSLSNLLARAYEGDEGLEVLKTNWDKFSSSLSRSEQLQVIDSALGILNFDSDVENLDNGIAFLEEMRRAGIKVGNQKLDDDGNSPMSDSYYITKIDDLEDMREAVERKQKASAISRASEFQLEIKETAQANADEGISEDDPRFQKYIDALEEQVKQDDSLGPFERAVKLTAIAKGVNDGYKQKNEDIDELESGINRGGSTISSASFGGELTGFLVKTVQVDLKNRKYRGVDVEKALIVDLETDSDINIPGDGVFTTIGLGPELRRIDTKFRTDYANKMNESVRQLVNTETGEKFKLTGSDKEYIIKEGENINNRREAILAEHMTSLIPGMMENAKTELIDVIEADKKAVEDKALAEDEEAKRLDDIAATRGLAEKSKEMLNIGPAEIASSGKKDGRTFRKAKRLYGTGIEIQREAGKLGDAFSTYKETSVNMPKLMDSLEHTIKYNPHSPEDMQIIMEDVEAIYDGDMAIIKGNLQTAHDLAKKSTGTASTKAERSRRVRELSTQVVRARRLFKGYTPDEVTKALSVGKGEPGYLPEGVKIGNPKAFFRNELLGEPEALAERMPKEGFKAAALLTDATDEQLAEIAALLDTDPEILKRRQKEYSDARSGTQPEKPVPTVPGEPPVTTPAPPVETPAPEPVKKERKPIITLEDIRSQEEARKQRKAEEQLELPLDTPAPAVGSVDKETTDLIKKFEGDFQPKAFWDVQQYSIGFGTRANEGEGQTMTLAQAEKELAKELSGHAKKVDSYNKIYNWTPNERAAMISFAFNLGNKGFDDLILKGKRTKQQIASKMLLYNNKRVDGKLQFSKGLDNRRKAEREKFLSK